MENGFLSNFHAFFDPAVAPDKCVRRTVMLEWRLLYTFQLRDNAFRQYLAQLDAPLIEGINLPDRPLSEDAVLVARNQLTERLRGQALCENAIRRPIAFANAVAYQPVRSTLGSASSVLRSLSSPFSSRMSRLPKHMAL